MDQTNTTTHRQYVDIPEQDGLIERYKIVSIKDDELYISMHYVDSGDTEIRYEPNRRGWEYGQEINESELPFKHIEELSDVKERLSRTESTSSETEKEKVRI